MASSDEPAFVIVTSRPADDRLWAELLNPGGFDVIAKPFDEKEVLHVLEAARRYSESSTSPQPVAAAG